MADQEERIEIQPSRVVNMISRKEMPSMPTTYPAPIEGIHLSGLPSTNLNPGSKRTCQNQGTSGRETRKPAREKILAIQRIVPLSSLGTNISRIAPMSGVNKMIERMWLCIVHPLRRRRRPRHRSCSSPGVVGDDSYQTNHHHQAVPLHQTPLQ